MKLDLQAPNGIPPNARSTPVLPAETSGIGFEVLPEISEKCRRRQTEFERAQLLIVLCQHATKQGTEGGRILGEENSKRCLEGTNWVCLAL